MDGLQKLTNALSNGTIPDPLRPPLPQNCGFATQLPPLISGTGKATDFKFGGYIYRANWNKSQLKILEKMQRGRIQTLPNFLGVPPIISGTGKATDFKFSRNIHRSIGTKAHEKCWEQQPWAQSGSPEHFQGTHVQGALCGHLCDSTAFLFLVATVDIQ